MKKPNDDCSSLGGIEPQTNLPFIPHQIKDYGVGIPVELAKPQYLFYASFWLLLTVTRKMRKNKVPRSGSFVQKWCYHFQRVPHATVCLLFSLVS